MSERSCPLRRLLLRTCGVALAVTAGACAEGEPAAPGAPGTIRVSVSTTSPTPVFVTTNQAHVGSASADVSDGAPVSFSEVPAGRHQVTISDVPNSCDVLGDGVTRLVSIEDGETVDVEFEIFCFGRLRHQIILSDFHSLWAINPDGSALIRLTDFDIQAWIEPASVSPDGSTLAFGGVGQDDGGINIYSLRFDGTAPLRLTPDPPSNDRGPSWSPDGTRIAYVTDDETGWRVAVIDVVARNTTYLTNGGDYEFIWNAGWSPEGGQIVFPFMSSGSWGIGLVNSDGSGARALPVPGITRWPSWAPNGYLLAVGHAPAVGEPEQLWIMDNNGSLLNQVTTSAVLIESPIWSPDGTRLVFGMESSDPTHAPGVWVTDFDGTDLRFLAAGKTPVAWAPR